MLGLTRYVVHGAGGGGNAPSLNLNFVDGSTFSPQITFTRASNATMFDSSGTLVYAPNNAIRNNTMVGAIAGVIGSGGAVPTNWTVPDAGMTVTVTPVIENGISCIDINWSGTATATNSRIFFDNVLPAAYDGQTWVGSTYLKLAAGTYTESVSLRVTGPSATLDESGTSIPYTNTLTRYDRIRTLAGGFSSVQVALRIQLTIGAVYDFTLRIGMPQLEIGPVATAVNATSGTAYYGPRIDYDPATLAVRGFLVEEQRTNSLTYSEQFDNAAWTKDRINTTGTPPWVNVEVAPDGATSADKLIEDTDPGTHYLAQNVTVVDATTYTVSFFAKAAERNRFRIRFGTNLGGGTFLGSADFDLLAGTVSATSDITNSSITPVGNGWYRCTVTDVSSGTTLGIGVFLILSGTTTSYTGDGTSGLYVWGAQIEAGAFPTSYIPTTTTALTRSADVASVNTLSPWYNAAEGTLFADFQDFAPPSGITIGRRAVEINSGSTPNMIAIGYGLSANENFGFVRSASVTQFNLDTVGTPSAKVALAYKNADFALCANGTSVVPQASGSVPSGMTQMDIGNSVDYTAARAANGHLRRITYYPRRLTDDQLQQITT